MINAKGNIKSLQTVSISMESKGGAPENKHIERFFRTIKHDRLYLNPSSDGNELLTERQTFINYYNKKKLFIYWKTTANQGFREICIKINKTLKL